MSTPHDLVHIDRQYTETDEKLKAQEQALRDEYRKVETGALNDELKQRVRQWVAGEAAAAKQKLGAALNGSEMEKHLREIVPGILCALFGKEVEIALVAQVVDDRSAMRGKLAELKARIDDIAAERARRFEANRLRTSPRQ